MMHDTAEIVQHGPFYDELEVSLRNEAGDAAASGFGATPCIHAGEVDLIGVTYAPIAEEREWAGRVWDQAIRQPGVCFEGKMVDQSIVRQTRELLGAEGR